MTRNGSAFPDNIQGDDEIALVDELMESRDDSENELIVPVVDGGVAVLPEADDKHESD